MLNHEWARQVLDDQKAENIVVLDVRELTSVTDRMIICSGRSERHVKAIASKLVELGKKSDRAPLGVEGLEHGRWVLIDLNDVIVHVMLPEVRDFYQIESLWQISSNSALSSS